MKFIATLLCSLFLAGCATGDYAAYAEVQKAQAAAQTARYQALAKIAEMGDTTAKVAAVMSLQNAGAGAQSQIAAPISGSQIALQWASILVPGVTQIYGIGQQVKLGMRQSDNSTALGISTNSAFVGMASQIQAPAPNMTLSGTGVLGSGSYSIGANSGQNSGNSGRLAGTSITDNTSTPTVVTQPTPVRPEIVRPEIVQITP
jgi:PBP1b-binding outer membrane lipoprotein LpoB